MLHKICDYGCGQKAKHQFKNGKWCCSKHYTCCPIEKNKCKIRNKGKNHPRFGIKHSKISRLKMHKSHKQKWNNLNKQNKNDFLKQLNKNRLGYEHNFKQTIQLIKKNYPTFSKIEEMRYNPDKPREKEIQVHCKNHLCKNSKEQGGWFTPKNRDQFRNRIYAIEHDSSESYYYYCSEECKHKCLLFKRTTEQIIKNDERLAKSYTSQEYQTFRQQVLTRENYICEYCDKEANTVHHSMPQKLELIHVLDPDYGIACCKKCHYKYGHKDECGTGVIAYIDCNNKK